MNRAKNSIPLLLLAILLATAQSVFAQRHWQPLVTDQSMSILIMDATLDGEHLTLGDEIAVFTPDELMAGSNVVHMGQQGDPNELADGQNPLSIAAWGDDANQDGLQGFLEDSLMSFKIWDHNADEEWNTEIFNVGGAGIRYQTGELTFLSLRAARVFAPNIDVSELEHDFGVVRLGRSALWSFTISNTGNDTLVVSNIESGNGVFDVNFNQEFALAARATRNFQVTFTPEEATDYATNITITSNDEDNNGEVLIHLTGVGGEALPPDIDLSAFDRRFGRVLIGQSRNMSLVISNLGDLALHISDISSGNQVFTTNFQDEMVINSGEHAELTITFTPRDLQVYQTNLTITSDDPDEHISTITLTGEGVEVGDPPVSTIMAEEHYYGAVVAGQSSAWRMVVTNLGGSDLTVTGAHSGTQFFHVEFGNDPVRLRPGDYLYLNTTFTPQAEASYEDMLTVVSNDSAHMEVSIPVAGQGIIQDNHHFHAYNSGVNHSLFITAATLGGNRLAAGAEVAVFTTWGLCAGTGLVNNQGMVGVAAYGIDIDTGAVVHNGFMSGEAFAFKVWDPNSQTEAWGTPTFEDTLEENPEVFTANGVSVLSLAALVGEPTPDISLSEMGHFYGQVAVDESENWVLTITNRGRGALTVTNISSDLGVYTTDFQNPFQLGLGDSRDITVTFAPEAFIDYPGRLTIMSDDPLDSVLYVDVFGVGVDVA